MFSIWVPAAAAHQRGGAPSIVSPSNVTEPGCSTLAQLATPDEEECGELDELLVELKKQDLPFIKWGLFRSPFLVGFCLFFLSLGFLLEALSEERWEGTESILTTPEKHQLASSQGGLV